MKTYLSILLLICAVNILIAQEQEKTIPINDLRSKGIMNFDTATAGHVSGELIVNREMSLRNFKNELGKDTVSEYRIRFFKPFDNYLRNYFMSWVTDEDFNNVNYKWMTDSTVDVTLINSITNKRRNLKLYQPKCKGCSAGLLKESFEELNKKNK
jgi:hypothetical protein